MAGGVVMTRLVVLSLAILCPLFASADEADMKAKAQQYFDVANGHRLARLALIRQRLDELKKSRIRNKLQIEKELRAEAERLEDIDSMLPPAIESLTVGNIGTLGKYRIKVKQIAGPGSMMAELDEKDFWVEGISTAGFADGDFATMKSDLVFEVSGTKTYTTVLGGTRTIMKVEVLDFAAMQPHVAALKDAYKAAHPKPEKKPRPTASKQDEWRTWKSADGKFSVEAKYRGTAEGKVKLEKKDGKTIQIEPEKLSADDLAWIRNRQ